jgi:hypothetical protein
VAFGRFRSTPRGSVSRRAEQTLGEGPLIVSTGHVTPRRDPLPLVEALSEILAAYPRTRALGPSEAIRVWHLLSHTSVLTYGFHHVRAVEETYRGSGYVLVGPHHYAPRASRTSAITVSTSESVSAGCTGRESAWSVSAAATGKSAGETAGTWGWPRKRPWSKTSLG